MGFLNWLSGQESNADSQLDLFQDSSSRIEKRSSSRVDGATVRKDLSKAVDDAGGSKDAHARGTERMTRGLMGCSTKELYEQTGGKKGDRSTLPHEAQKAIIIAETKATHDIKDNHRQGNYGGNQQQVDEQIADTMGDAGKKTRGFLGLW